MRQQSGAYLGNNRDQSDEQTSHSSQAGGMHARQGRWARVGLRLAPWLVWVAIGVLCMLRFVHLRADFPNFSPWMDPSKYTDEGWYANAATRHALTGHWRLPGDFNPAVALPVWPLLARGAFLVGGVGVEVLRAAGLVVWMAVALLSYAVMRRGGVGAAGARLGLLLLAADAYAYAFSRLALLEPLEVGWVLAAWWVVLGLGPRMALGRRLLWLAVAGLLCALALLSKTTALFLLPSVGYLLWWARGFCVRAALGDLVCATTAGALGWAVYFFACVRPHLLVDFHYLFTSNRFPQPTTAAGWFWAFWYALHGVLWLGPGLCALAGAVLVLGLHARQALWREPLIVAPLLVLLGTVFFIGWHNNPQPRYYEVILFPLAMLLCRGAQLAGGRLVWAALGLLVMVNTVRTLGYVQHPQYTWWNAAQALARTVRAHPEQGQLVLSISGDDLQLMTGLPAICDDYGTTDLPFRIHQYRPGWYAAWNELDAGAVEDIGALDRLEKVAEFPAFDDPDRDVLVLYKLLPLPRAKQTYDEQAERVANQAAE